MGNLVNRLAEVLLIEDSASDARLAREAFREGRSNARVQVVDDCGVALRYLRQQGEFADATRPDLVLLDLNLNGQSGLELLVVIKQDPLLQSIPISVLTTSQDDGDVQSAYRAGANCYVIKPVGLDEFIELVRALDTFWFQIATLPPR